MRILSLAVAVATAGALVGCSAVSTDGQDEDATSADQNLDAVANRKTAQATQLRDMLNYVQDGTAWHAPLDWAKLRADGELAIANGDGSDAAFYHAMWHAFIAVPQGHQGITFETGCGSVVPWASYAQRGVCGRPHERGVIITNARASNALGLKKGDVVLDVLDSLVDRPMCTGSRPSVHYAEATAAATFGSLVHAGERLTVEAPDGTRREVVVPPLSGLDAQLMDCHDPFGRSTQTPADATIRPDGVAVIRVPSWINPLEPWPENPTVESLAAYRERFEQKLQDAFDSVKHAPAIVWDIRGNGGGLTQVGLDIVSGMDGAEPGEISYCQSRIYGSDPPRYEPFRYATYALQPGGRFAYAGKVAVLIDGANYSAADYFPLAIKAKTRARLVGSPTAGAFGATSHSRSFTTPATPPFSVSIDVNHCVTSDDGVPLEGRSVEPHVAVGYDAKDLAAGRDTVLERAVAELVSP